MHFGCERDRLALPKVELRLNEAAGPKNLHPRGRITGPVLDRFRRQGVLELCQHGRWNQNSRV